MTANETYIIALALLDELNTDGSVPDSYNAVALPILNLIQNEIAKVEGVTAEQLSALSDGLSISLDSSQRIMPYGVAAKIALVDGTEGTSAQNRYMEYANEYQRGLKSIPATESAITDSMGVVYDRR